MRKHKIILFYLTDHTEWVFNVLQSILNLQAETYNTFMSLHVWTIHGKFSMVKKLGRFTQACNEEVGGPEFRSIDWTNHLDWLANFYHNATGDFGLGNYDPRQIDLIVDYCDRNNIPYQTICFPYAEQQHPYIVRHAAECQIHRVDAILPWSFLTWQDILWKYLPYNTRLKKYTAEFTKLIPDHAPVRDTQVVFDLAKILDKSAVEQFVYDLGFPAFAPNAQEYYDEWRRRNIDFYT